MLYLSYDASKRLYLETQGMLEAILDEQAVLFARTQPNAVSFDKERVSSSGSDVNMFEQYVIAKEKKRIDERLSEVKGMLADRAEILRVKELELRQSDEIHDKIYCMKYIDRKRVYKIARTLNYSERQIWRVLNEIQDAIGKDVTKCQSNVSLNRVK